LFNPIILTFFFLNTILLYESYIISNWSSLRAYCFVS